MDKYELILNGWIQEVGYVTSDMIREIREMREQETGSGSLDKEIARERAAEERRGW